MSKLKLSVAIGNYDRARALFDGSVQIDGVDPVFMMLPPEEIFFRAFRYQEFDVCELSFSSFIRTVAAGNSAYIGVPAFVSRIFRHSGIYIRTDAGIGAPSDASLAMEIGADACLVNTAVALAESPATMAEAIAMGVRAGRLAYLSGRIPKKAYASASSPLEGVVR